MSKTALVILASGVIILVIASAAYGMPSLRHYAGVSRGFQAIGAVVLFLSLPVAMLTYRGPNHKSPGR